MGQDSAYSQLQTALKVRNENSLVSADIDTQRPYTAAWEPKSKRMLKLFLTDGFRTVAALEFEPISQLKYPVPPGKSGVAKPLTGSKKVPAKKLLSALLTFLKF